MSKSLLIDTNLLVILVVGLYDVSYIGKHKRTKNYLPEDYETLLQVTRRYNEIWITSQSVAECSNLLRQTDQSKAEKLLKTFFTLITTVKESNMSSQIIFSDTTVYSLGITDAGLVKKSKRVTNLITTDFDLYQEVDRKFKNAINFNHIRTGAWTW